MHEERTFNPRTNLCHLVLIGNGEGLFRFSYFHYKPSRSRHAKVTERSQVYTIIETTRTCGVKLAAWPVANVLKTTIVSAILAIRKDSKANRPKHLN